MKKLVIALVACMALPTGCGEKIEKRWDYPNVDVVISVVDAYGTDLLTFGNLLRNNIVVTYEGTRYRLPSIARAAEPVLPEWTGLTLDVSRDPNILRFGQFSIDTRDYRGETFTIDWGDGTSNEIKFDLYATPNGNDQPTIHEATWVDGTPNSSGSLSVKIVR